ncbi:U4/U6 small nuclear ribonucleoprotein Prp31 [Wickerhamiella sorbophila]|uniref:U4/U6 small nuclear ribonucleoprotein Prp31 n=1 Tax=Wickerhamiella sorbophila TaxID=45607 RepID=A0A2T0FCQ4_9ASCO|nr:U4/U6 small nuclear ribonucleoprotein Prp31 [Wickerhamiella sorbophila]PRT52784.1 U4/U6 small nuclear ribonucleoprotein Prp31 [Wickerhamiella sorbophila]
MDIDELLEGLSDSGDDQTTQVVGPVAEDSPAELTVRIDEMLEPLGNQLKECYAPRFPELQALVPDLEEFCHIIKLLGPELTPNSQALEDIVGKQRAMVVQMSMAETPGRELTDSEWGQLQQILDNVFDLMQKREQAMQTLAQELSSHAPNLLGIVRLSTAVRLVAYRGGLAELASTPSANLISLGAPKASSVGGSMVRQGFIYNDPLVRGVPLHHKRQAVRMVSAKVVLAARMDLAKSSTDGSQGRLWRGQILDRLEKLSRAPISAQDRAITIREDKPSKKRGGRRARRFKLQLTPTELQRQRDRLAFGSSKGDYGV